VPGGHILKNHNALGVNMTLKDAIIRESRNDRLRCADALLIADELQVPPGEIGKMCNELGIKIINCQLGCFP